MTGVWGGEEGREKSRARTNRCLGKGVEGEIKVLINPQGIFGTSHLGVLEALWGQQHQMHSEHGGNEKRRRGRKQATGHRE